MRSLNRIELCLEQSPWCDCGRTRRAERSGEQPVIFLAAGAHRACLCVESITTLSSVPDDLYKNVRQHFTDDEVVELTATITWEICAAKFNRALEIEAQGICAVRAPPALLP